MPKTFSYDRPKSVVVNSTGIDVTLFASEKPDAPVDISGTGTTGELHALFKADADESGGADVQTLFKLEALPVVGADGSVSLRVTVTPIMGASPFADGTAQQMTVPHDQTMDAWQTAAGRARQA
jgi:hypothetical protein